MLRDLKWINLRLPHCSKIRKKVQLRDNLTMNPEFEYPGYIVKGKNTYSQISTAKGFMKENSLVGFPLGILNKIEIPKFMKGLVKSMTASRAKFMVRAPTAKSAFPPINSEI